MNIINKENIEKTLSLSIPLAITSGVQAALSHVPYLAFLAPTPYFGAEVVVFYKAQDAVRQKIASFSLMQKVLNKLPPLVKNVGEWALFRFEFAVAVAGAVALNYSTPALAVREIVLFSYIALEAISISEKTAKKIIEIAQPLITTVKDKIYVFQKREFKKPMSFEDLEKLICNKDEFEKYCKEAFDVLQKDVPPTPSSTKCKIANAHTDDNRYRDVLPYDNTRAMKDVPDFYINASEMSDANDDIQLIVTQGPKERTMTNFWKMIEHYEAKNIVMIGSAREGNNEKWEEYTRTEKPLKYDFDDTSICLNQFAEKVMESNEDTTAFVHHFRFKMTSTDEDDEGDTINAYQLTCEDHSPPNLELLHALIKKINQQLNSQPSMSKKPALIVHCSAGIGRSGVFATCYEIYRQISQQPDRKNVDVYKIVKELRQKRAGMIQNYKQYMACLKYAVLCKNGTFPKIKETDESSLEFTSIEDWEDDVW